MSQALHFDYAASKRYCKQIGLTWLGDDWVRDSDDAAWVEGFTQQQVDVAMRHHLWQVRTLFTPQVYRWYQRLFLAFYFITGWKLSPRSS